VIRSTNNQAATHVLDDLQRVSANLQRTQRKLSTGKEINQVEDDPVGAGRALFLRSEVSDVQQYQKNINEALGFQDASESAMSSGQDIMKRAKELVVQAGNGALDQSGLNNIAAEIKQLVGAARESMNGTYAGRYLFSGTATLTKPFPSPGLTYAGDDNVMQRVIGQGEQVDLNLRGWEAFSVVAASLKKKALQLLDQIATDLQSGNRAALGNADLQGVDNMLDQLSAARAQVGARTNRLETQQTRLKDTELNVEDLLSKTEDADMAKAMVDFSMQQSIYQSALQSGARVLQPSLLDFLR